MGDSINMAARLMCLPYAANSILCDEKTYNLSERDFFFDFLGEVNVKGKATPISTFRPKALRPENGKGSSNRDNPREICGRLVEKAAIINAITQHVDGEPSGLVVIESDAGQGLSTLVKYTKVEAMERNCHVW